MAAGGLILYPTDTIWGIGCDATNEEAVRRVYELKRRSDHKAMLLLMDSSAKLNYYVQEEPDVAWDLIELAYSPVTVIYSGARNVAPNLLAEDGSVGIRIPLEGSCIDLVKRFGRLLVSTSANISGEPSPKNFDEIPQCIKDGVDYIVNPELALESSGKASQIIKVGLDSEIKIIRA